MTNQSTLKKSAPLKNPMEVLFGYQLRRASQAMFDDLISNIADLDFRPTSAAVLLFIGENPGITQSVIGRSLDIERANLTPLTAKLSERGLLSRVKTDGRSHGLRLTKTGTQVALQLRGRIAEHEERFLSLVSPKERALMMRILKALRT